MSNLNVVALISGGKDSFFSILHCQANSHNVVALANLHPPHVKGSGPVDDLESYMYQTVGHAVIPLYEQALGLPLYRQEIFGGATNQNKSYGVTPETAQDETESLLPLLRKVIAAHPEVNAVSTGAILSDYQRTRVESVAIRLGLTPLSYLWQWPFLPPHTPESLLEDMASVGQDSRIIKVASGGLDDSFLWQNVADRRTIARLKKATGMFGSPGDGAVLGEGGEYETLALSGPGPLWKGDICIPDEGVCTLSGEAGSASVRLSQPSVCPKEETKSPVQTPRPPLLEDRFKAIYDDLCIEGESGTIIPPEVAKLNLPLTADAATNHQTLKLSNLTGSGSSAAEQARSIMDSIMSRLSLEGQSPADIAYTIITLRNMDEFAAVNAVYGSYFVSPNPPARATIACTSVLPADSLLTMSIVTSPAPREGLHVQSRSYWAPANIGPYSQAVRFPDSSDSGPLRGAVLIAGQIPLVPATMALPETSDPAHREHFKIQAVLSLQHLYRISKIMKVRQHTYAIALIAQTGDRSDLAAKANTVRHAWRLFHEPRSSGNEVGHDDDDDFDIWHQTYGAGKTPWLAQQSDAIEDESNLQTGVPPLVIISVDSLPRQSDVEWIGYGKTTTGHNQEAPVHLESLLDAFHSRILPE